MKITQTILDKLMEETKASERLRNIAFVGNRIINIKFIK